MSAIPLIGVRFQALSLGGIVSGGSVHSYQAGTLLDQYTYSGPVISVGTRNQNPVTLDAAGQASIYLDPALAYRFIVKDKFGATVPGGDVDNWTSLQLELASTAGSNAVGFLQAGTGAVARTAQSKLRESISVLDFGGVGDGVADDTLAITAAYAAALAAGAELIFPAGTWAVSTVTFGGSDAFVRFAGNARLKGIAASSQSAVLQITGRQLVIYNLQVDANFNSNYTKGAVWWRSVSNALPAQVIRIFGMKVSNCMNGLVYGDVVGGTPVDAAQSENVIEGFVTRACQIPFVGNQPNGFITLISPILDCNANEWASQPGYNATTFNTAARCIWNPAGGSNHLNVIGGEIIKTTSTLGYGIVGGTINITAPNAIEIAGIQGLIDGELSISYCRNWAMTAGGLNTSTLNAFLIEPTASALGALTIDSCSTGRTAAGSSSSSTASFIAAASGSPVMPITIVNSTFLEWRWDSTVPFVSGCVLKKWDNNVITVNTRGSNTVVNQTPLGVSTATATVLGTDCEVIVNYAGTCTVTLPAPASFSGKYLRFLNLSANAVVSASSNVLPLGGTVNGTAMLAATAGKWCEMQSDGTNWRILRAN